MTTSPRKSRAKLTLIQNSPTEEHQHASRRFTQEAQEFAPWLTEPRMKAIFQSGLSLLPLQPWDGKQARGLLCTDGEFSFSYMGKPFSADALAYWRRLVALTSKHHGNRNRGAIRFTPEEKTALDQLASLCITLRCQGRGQFFSTLVPSFHYNSNDRLAIFELCPVFAALEREHLKGEE